MSEQGATELASLLQIPAAVGETLALVAALDRCLLLGLASLDEGGRRTVRETADLFEGSTLHRRLAAAHEALARHEYRGEQIAALAAAGIVQGDGDGLLPG